MGGREAMQIDHFRPYSRKGFEHLKDDPSNFHHACARCNLLKRNLWACPDEDCCHNGVVGFIDPFKEVRSFYFRVLEDGRLVESNPPALYTIKLLALNRAHLIKLRLLRILCAKLKSRIAAELPKIRSGLVGEGEYSKEEAALLACELVEMTDLYLALTNH